MWINMLITGLSAIFLPASPKHDRLTSTNRLFQHFPVEHRRKKKENFVLVAAGKFSFMRNLPIIRKEKFFVRFPGITRTE